MRIGAFALGLAGIALTPAFSQALLAQAAPSVSVMRLDAGFGAGVVARSTMPYTATRKTTRVQKLANGVTITHVTTAKEARDSSGRSYSETWTEPAPGGEAENPSFHFFSVHDPVNRVNINWNSQSKEAVVNDFPDNEQMRRVDPPPIAPAAPTVRPRIEQPQVEDLGIKTISGLEAKGQRITRVIPAGRDGNDQPITITQETWHSTELGILVMSVRDDPRTGTQTMELTEIERGEPDAALFKVPEGYTVKERPLGETFGVR